MTSFPDRSNFSKELHMSLRILPFTSTATRRVRTLRLAIALVASAATVTTSYAQLSVSGGTKKFNWNDQVSKNQFVWVSDAPVEKIRGTAEGVTGSISFDPKDLTTLRGTVTTDVRTMKSGNGTRDNHLLSAEWMDPARFPSIKFTIESVSDVKVNGTSATAMAAGDFTMHGVTKRITVPFKINYIAENAKTRERAPGDLLVVNANFSIALKDFKIEGTSGLVGSKVGESIQITANLFGNSQ
jgi:polyisoprenoid-binding protein YceI